MNVAAIFPRLFAARVGERKQTRTPVVSRHFLGVFEVRKAAPSRLSYVSHRNLARCGNLQVRETFGFSSLPPTFVLYEFLSSPPSCLCVCRGQRRKKKESVSRPTVFVRLSWSAEKNTETDDCPRKPNFLFPLPHFPFLGPLTPAALFASVGWTRRLPWRTNWPLS